MNSKFSKGCNLNAKNFVAPDARKQIQIPSAAPDQDN
jgi:hypothetical protein